MTREGSFPYFLPPSNQAKYLPPRKTNLLLIGMEITYKDHKKFNRAEVEELFLSVDWSSGHYPDLLVEALKNYGSVFSAWDGDKLVGLAASMDDKTMTAYLHYMLVHSSYQNQGIGQQLLEMVKDYYTDYLRVVLVAYSSGKTFYERNGFVPDEGIYAMNLTSLYD